MKLATKVKILFIAMILVPLVFGVVGFLAVSNFKLYSFNSQYNTHEGSVELFANPLHLVTLQCEQQCKALEDAADQNAELFTDEAWLTALEEQLQERNANLIVVEDAQETFCPDPSLEEVAKTLSCITIQGEKEAGLYLEDYGVVVQVIEYERESHAGQAFVVMSVGGILPQMKTFTLDAFCAIVLALILTSALFTIWIYSQTVKPIDKLRLGTRNIKEGNLDFEMKAKGRDEFAELYRDFDAMRQQLKEDQEGKVLADQQSRELLSNISHDLKTPITAIKGYVEGIMDGVANTPEKQEKYLKIVYSKACEMDTLINELTFYSKIDSNKIPYNFAKIPVVGYFTDCVEEISLELEARGITCGYVNEVQDSTRILADPEQLRRVIHNIIGNSVKYMQNKPARISIHLQEDRKNVFIALSDNGIGIAQGDIPHIFNRFYRSDASRNSKTGGSGIGLSIVKKIVEDHGGLISCESLVGEGTTMHITLPKYIEEDKPLAALPSAK